MCSIIVFFYKIYYTFRDLHTRVILSNILKVTLDVVETFFFTERTAAHASSMHLYIIFAQKLSMCYWKTELVESYQGLLETYYVLLF